MSTPSQLVIDDNLLCTESSSNNCFAYTGTQWTGDTDPQAVNQTVHTLPVNASATNAWSVRFSGTAINVFGIIGCQNPPCNFDLQVDAGPVTHELPAPSFKNILQLGADTLGNQTANHTLVISDSSHVRIDYALVDAPNGTTTASTTTTSLLPSSPIQSSALTRKSHPGIAGPVAGSVVGAVLVTALFLIIWVRRRRQRLLSSETIAPFQQLQAEQGTAAAGPWLASSKRAMAPDSAPPAVVRSGPTNELAVPPAVQEETTTAGIVRELVARVDTLVMDRVPPPSYVG
ncbi:hypothetical protein C8R46DRAFT_1295309 [Mycena filopes]|nr:hypothetical protein C8R46DRAFT_1295309 [Mycena filopes]